MVAACGLGIPIRLTDIDLETAPVKRVGKRVIHVLGVCERSHIGVSHAAG